MACAPGQNVLSHWCVCVCVCVYLCVILIGRLVGRSFFVFNFFFVYLLFIFNIKDR